MVYDALIQVALRETIHQERDLLDFSMMLGSKDLLKKIDGKIKGARPVSSARLRRMKAAAQRGMRLRGRAA
jgi:hypothetical protein